jgi:hypothetical protein
MARILLSCFMIISLYSLATSCSSEEKKTVAKEYAMIYFYDGETITTLYPGSPGTPVPTMSKEGPVFHMKLLENINTLADKGYRMVSGSRAGKDGRFTIYIFERDK